MNFLIERFDADLFPTLIILCFLYFIIKLALSYRETRNKTHLFIMLFTSIFVSNLWIKMFGKNVGNLFSRFGFLLPAIPVLIFLFFNLLETRRMDEEKEKERIRSFFDHYVNPNIVNKIVSEKKLKLNGERKKIAILFTDMRGFTKLSEEIKAEEVVKILNKHFDDATKIIFKYNGTIDKFIGDSVMAIFNAPIEQKNFIENAVESAIEIQKETKEINELLLKEKINKKITFGIGITVGEAIIGNIGSNKFMNYTAIGDVVNTASRLTAIAKPGQIVVDENVYNNVKGRFRFKKLQPVMVKGKKIPLKIYGVVY